MAWIAHETVGPMLWGREPYRTTWPIIGSELLRFRQSFDPYHHHRPWKGGIILSQLHLPHGIVRRVRLPVITGEFIVREFRYPPEIKEAGNELFDLIVRPYGRWRPEADWLLEVEYWW